MEKKGGGREREYIEDKVLVGRFPSQATPEVYVPDQDQDDGNDTQNVNHVGERNSRYTQRHRSSLLSLNS